MMKIESTSSRQTIGRGEHAEAERDEGLRDHPADDAARARELLEAVGRLRLPAEEMAEPADRRP